jgi:predicted phage gp36 major capsid-like protein
MPPFERGLADLDDPALKERIAELKATRDQARLDAERAAAALETNGQAITVDHLRRFAEAARRRMRTPQGYRRDHLRALAQRVEVADGEVRIMGSKTTLLRTLTTIGGVETAAGGVRISVPNWRSETNRNPTLSGLWKTLAVRRSTSVARCVVRRQDARSPVR